MATPFLQGLTKAMDMLEHDLEEDAKGLTTKILDVGARGKAAIAKGHTRIDGVSTRVGQVEKFVTAIEGSNGGNPLTDSSNSSGKPPPVVDEAKTDSSRQGETQTVTAAEVGEAAKVIAEPAASWGGKA